MHIVTAIFIIYIVILLILIYIGYTAPARESLSSEDYADTTFIMVHFHENPNFDDFMEIWNNRDLLYESGGHAIYYWLYGVYSAHPQFYDRARRDGLRPHIKKIYRGLQRMYEYPTIDLLYCVWSLYFATGDQKYIQIITHTAEAARDASIRAAAQWSLRNTVEPTIVR